MFTDKQLSLILSVLFFCWRYKEGFGSAEMISIADKFHDFLIKKEKK